MRRIVLLVALAACRTKAGDSPPCATVAGRFFTLAHADLDRAHVDDTLRRQVADQLPAMRDSLDHICSEGAWPAAVRDCMVEAEDRTALEACEQKLTDEQRAALDRGTRGETPSP
ncbi:MAG: hypothetical protein ACM31C_17270 [Acidobacteriota bacterium]